MSKLRLSIAMGNYDRTRPIIDGSVLIDGVDPIPMLFSPEEMFFRALRHREFDVSELSLSSYCVHLAEGRPSYIAVPVFLSRAFRHTSIYIRNDVGINEPEDLIGRKIGIAEYQLTANVWARAMLEDDHGVRPADINWVRGGMNTPDRPEKLKVKLPDDVIMEQAPTGVSLDEMLVAGDIDGFVGPRQPRCYIEGHPKVGRLFADSVAAAEAYYSRTQVFPIMHVLGIRRELAREHPWLPGALLKAFTQAKHEAQVALNDTSATKVTLPFVEEYLGQARALMGIDFWSYGAKENRHVIENFLDHHYRQGLSSKKIEFGQLFHPATYESYSI